MGLLFLIFTMNRVISNLFFCQNKSSAKTHFKIGNKNIVTQLILDNKKDTNKNKQ